MKLCIICKTRKPLTEFATRRSNRDSKHTRCKDCESKIVKDKYAKQKEEKAYWKQFSIL